MGIIFLGLSLSSFNMVFTRSQFARCVTAEQAHQGELLPCRERCGCYGTRENLYLCSVCVRKQLPPEVHHLTESPTPLQLYESALEKYGVGKATGQEARVLRAACRAVAAEDSIADILATLTTTYRDLVLRRNGLFLILEYDALQMMASLDHLRDQDNWYKLSQWVGRLVYVPWISLRDPAFDRATLCYFGHFGDGFLEQATAEGMAFKNPYSVYLGTSGIGNFGYIE